MTNDTNGAMKPPVDGARFKELEKTCFVIMPFGKKTVGNGEVDFDEIYEKIFESAINKVMTPEGENCEKNRQGCFLWFNKSRNVRVYYV